MINISTALFSLRPGAKWILRNEHYAGLEWNDDSQIKPTLKEVNEEIARLEAEFVAAEYKRQRAAAYPTIQEQLDMQYHDALNGTTTWQDTIASIKQQFPK